MTILSSQQNSDILNNTDSSDDTDNSTSERKLTTYLALLMGNGTLPQCIPHLIHIIPITDEVRMLILIENGNNTISSGIYEIFHNFNIMQTVQMQKDSTSIRPALENLDNAIKKVLDAFKKTKNLNDELDNCQKKLANKWDTIHKKYKEFLKTCDAECVLRIESNTMVFIETLRELLELAVFNTTCGNVNVNECIIEAAKNVNKRLSTFSDFLKVKAIRNFTLGSYPFFYYCFFFC